MPHRLLLPPVRPKLIWPPGTRQNPAGDPATWAPIAADQDSASRRARAESAPAPGIRREVHTPATAASNQLPIRPLIARGEHTSLGPNPAPRRAGRGPRHCRLLAI